MNKGKILKVKVSDDYPPEKGFGKGGFVVIAGIKAILAKE